MTKFHTLEEMIAVTCEAVRPAERLTVSQSAEKYRYINNPGSYVGKWDNSIAPYLTEIQDETMSEDKTGVIFAGPARCGKSDIFFNLLNHTAICDPADMMLIHMTQNTARDWSIGDLRKVFRDTKPLGSRVVPGRQNMNVHDVRFLSGMRLLIKWPSIAELSGKTIQRLWLMDMDRMPLDIDKNGSPYDLAKKRAETFGRYGMTVAESSPGFTVEDPAWKPKEMHEAPPTQGILSLYNRGDRRRWYWECPHCHKAFEPDFKLLHWPDSADHLEAAEQAWMSCPRCDGRIYHDENNADKTPGKNELNQGGKWVKAGQVWVPREGLYGTALRSDTASFWLKGPAAWAATWKNLVYRYLKAYEEYEKTGAEEALKTTTNVDQGDPYTPKKAQSDRLPEDIKNRAENWPEQTVPNGVRFLIATIDVQKNRFVVQVHGIGVGGDIYVIDRYEIKKSERTDEDGERLWVKPGSYLEDWKLLVPQVMEKTYPLADGSGRRMGIKATGCDSAGKEGVTKTAYDFWRWLRDECDNRDLVRRFLLTKGGSSKTAPRVQISYPDTERKDRHAGARGEVPVLFINTDTVKDQLNAMLDRTDALGGRVVFPKWLPDWFYGELTVEIKTPSGWKNPSDKRNESWDLLVYCIAICLSKLVKLEQIDWQSPPSWAEEFDDNDFVISESENKPFATKVKDDYNLEELAANLA